jgi:hypothetical protein
VATNWVLIVELDGEWEKCLFRTQKEALAAFIALASDYEPNLHRAFLIRAPEPADYSRHFAAYLPSRTYIN